MFRQLLLCSALLISALPCGAAPAQTAPGNFSKAISFSILEDYDKGEDLGGVEADFRLFRELGIETWRGSFGWDDYEPQPRDYDFAWLHRFADLAARHGIALRPYLAYTPAWAAKPGGLDDAVWNNPPASPLDWQAFASRIAAAMKSHENVLSFEIYNEQNSPLWWDGSRASYGQVLKKGSLAIRAAEGGDQVVLGGITYPDLEWIEQVCTGGNGEHFDVLALHAYPETWPTEIAVEDYLDQHAPGSFHGLFMPEADQVCGKKPVWINETGFATTPGKKTEREQANWWVRAIATFVADRRIEHIGIYEIKDRPKEADVIGEPENYYLGITYSDRRKKLAFHTIKRLVRLLDATTLTVADNELSVAGSGEKGRLYHHLFIRPDGGQVLFVWDKNGSPVLDLTLSRPGRSATEYGLDGTGVTYAQFDGRTLHDVRLSPGDVRIFEIFP